MTRLREWFGETHSDTFELVRHFLARFFDSELGATNADWQRVAIGMFAALVSLGLCVFQVYYHRFALLQVPDISTPALYQEAVRGDLLKLLAMVMGITALLTLVQWHSLFPTLRDCLALAGFPVSARQIFLAKFTALLLLFTAFSLSLNAPASGLFGTVISGGWQLNPSNAVLKLATLAATLGGCAFVFFTLLALQGLLLNIVPTRSFLRVSLIVQAVLFIAVMGAFPLLGRQPEAAWWWPPNWFRQLWESMVTGPASLARPGLLAVSAPPLAAVLFYLLSYHRYRRLLLETPPARSGGRFSGAGSRLLESWIPDPREQAAFSFMWKTLARSHTHRLILLAYCGIAIGWVVKGALDSPPVTLRDEGMYGLMSAFVPLGLATLTILALRYLFTLPVTLRANWMFQTADAEGRAAWLGAVQRFVIGFGIVPVYLASLPATIVILGPLRALALTALGVLVSLLVFERLFREWRKLPFTCSYLPGKKPVWLLLFRWSAGMVYLAAVPPMILSASGDPASFLALCTLLAGIWWRWRSIRRREWDESTLIYEESHDDDLFALRLRPLEEDAVVSSQARAPEIFSSGLVASRGFLPAAWEEELDEDRSHPGALLRTFLEDLRYGCRLIRRSPLLSLVVVLTLTVGIGINASVFTVVNAMMLRTHVSRDPDTFVRIVPESRLQSTPIRLSTREYLNLRDRTRSVRQLAGFSYFMAMIGDDDPGANPGIAVSCNFFQVEGLDRPILGRLIGGSDCDSPGQVPPAVINEKTWHTRFASDPHIIGRAFRLNNRPFTVAGVVRDTTTGWLTPPSVWIPYTAQPYMDATRNALLDEKVLWLSLCGRLAPGFSRSQARAEFEILEHQEDRLHPGRSTAVVSLDGSWLDEFELNLSARELMLMSFFIGAFLLVLLIACANVATLLLSRAATRRKEIAVRLSLGAPRIRLVRMLITESLLLAAIAGSLSIYLVRHIPRPLFRYLAPRSPEFPMQPDWLIFAWLAFVVVLTGIISGLAPALESVNVDLSTSIKGQAGSASGNRVRGWLVSAQVAMSMVLLVSAALFGKAEDRSLHADPGYLPQKVVVAPVRFQEGTTTDAARLKLAAIAQRVRSLPGVHAVAFSDGLPMLDSATLELRPPGRADAVQPVDVYSASPGFFDTLGVPIVRGREFQESDRAAVVVSRTLARTFWPREDPLGKTVTLEHLTATVVGVAKDVEGNRFGASENMPMYRMRQVDATRNVMSVRFEGDVKAGASALRALFRNDDPGMLAQALVLQEWINQVTEVLWNVVSLILLLGIVATVLATTGIYGAVSFAVTQRGREMGIRLALGAQRRHIVREIFLSGGRPVLRGLFLGLWLSVALAASLHSSARGTPLRLDSDDPLIYGGAALLLASAAVIAMAGPARRGSKSDPLDALREA
jgi:predicted permease